MTSENDAEILELMDAWDPREPEKLREGIIALANKEPSLGDITILMFLFSPQEPIFVLREWVREACMLEDRSPENLAVVQQAAMWHMLDQPPEQEGIREKAAPIMERVKKRVDDVFKDCEEMRTSTYHGDGNGTACTML